MEIRWFLLPDGIGMWLNVDSDPRLPGFKGGFYHLIKLCNVRQVCVIYQSVLSQALQHCLILIFCI